MTKKDLCEYIRTQPLAVVSTINGNGAPEAAVVGIAVSPDLEIIFDTTANSRKYRNLLSNPRIALVIGWDNETTVQLEGTARCLPPEEAHPLKEIYFAAFPDGRQRASSWPGLVHFAVTPRWIRYSNFNKAENPIQEWQLPQ